MLSHDQPPPSWPPAQPHDTGSLLADHLIELEVVRGLARLRRRTISVPAFLMGRAEDCDLVLGDPRFPEAFAYLLIRGKQLILRHLGFAPELSVNGKAVTQVRLVDGDCIAAGQYEFRIHVRELDSPVERGGRLGGARGLRPETARAVARTEAIAEALDLIRSIREEVLGEKTTFRLYLGPEGHLANLPALATLPVDSAAFSGRGGLSARSA